MTEVIEFSETWATIEATEGALERRRQRRQAALAKKRRGGGDRSEARGTGGFQSRRAVVAEGRVPVFGTGDKGWEAVSACQSETARRAWERAGARPPAARVPDRFVVTGPVLGAARATAT